MVAGKQIERALRRASAPNGSQTDNREGGNSWRLSHDTEPTAGLADLIGFWQCYGVRNAVIFGPFAAFAPLTGLASADLVPGLRANAFGTAPVDVTPT